MASTELSAQLTAILNQIYADVEPWIETVRQELLAAWFVGRGERKLPPRWLDALGFLFDTALLEGVPNGSPAVPYNYYWSQYAGRNSCDQPKFVSLKQVDSNWVTTYDEQGYQDAAPANASFLKGLFVNEIIASGFECWVDQQNLLNEFGRIVWAIIQDQRIAPLQRAKTKAIAYMHQLLDEEASGGAGMPVKTAFMTDEQLRTACANPDQVPAFMKGRCADYEARKKGGPTPSGRGGLRMPGTFRPQAGGLDLASPECVAATQEGYKQGVAGGEKGKYQPGQYQPCYDVGYAKGLADKGAAQPAEDHTVRNVAIGAVVLAALGVGAYAIMAASKGEARSNPSGLTFYTPPVYQGQIVEVSYAIVEDGVIERVYDRGDRTESYALAAWTPALEDWANNEGPWNTPPPSANWETVSAGDVARFAA